MGFSARWPHGLGALALATGRLVPRRARFAASAFTRSIKPLQVHSRIQVRDLIRVPVERQRGASA